MLGNRHFHLFAVGKGPAVLLEGGVSAVVPLVEDQLAQGLGPPEVSHLVIMHAHFDHVCGVPGLKELLPGVRVAGSAEARKLLQRPKIVAGFFREDAAMAEVLRGEGLLPGQPGPKGETIEVDQVIEDGSKWDLGPGLELYFYRAPGHSPCSLMGYLPAGEVLFSSDCAGFPIDEKRFFPIFFDGYDDYVATIQRMRELPVELLAGAHEYIVRGKQEVREQLDLARIEAERARDLICGLSRKGHTNEEIAGLLFQQCYTGHLRIYSEQNIQHCCAILTKRALATEG